MKDRAVMIMDLLASNEKIKISLLAEILDVSLVTLRKDLNSLEKKGILCRFHGFVSLNSANDTAKRMAINHSIKKRIAKSASLIVEEGDTVLVESGSCCAMLADELALAGKNINLVTNSTFIAHYIMEKNIMVTLLGGFFQPKSQVLVGPITKRCAEHIYSQKLFIGTNGFIPDYGFTGQDHLHAETVMELAKNAKEVFVITEAAKFNRRGACNLIQFDKITGVFTDDGIPAEAENTLTKNNVKVYKVPSAEENYKWNQFPGQTPVLSKEKEQL